MWVNATLRYSFTFPISIWSISSCERRHGTFLDIIERTSSPSISSCERFPGIVDNSVNYLKLRRQHAACHGGHQIVGPV